MALLPAARCVMGLLLFGALSTLSPDGWSSAEVIEPPERPNILVVLTDDMGYADLGAYGATRIRTPHIDSLASQGIRFTQGYASANVCTPSRAGLMTGRYAIRSGLAWKVIESDSVHGMPASEETLAELVERAGYSTMLVGKWHLGHTELHWPLEHGFQSFYGVPFSNDMSDFALYEGTQRVEYPVRQETLTARYTRRAVQFIRRSAGNPFLLVVSHTFPHIPLYASNEFSRTSDAGTYGDVVQEIDWSTGELMKALAETGVLDNTLVLFTSDNGPFFEGGAAPLRGGKGSTWDGGYRVPFIAFWPRGILPGRVSNSMVSNIDILPTVADVVGLKPAAEEIDGRSLLPVFQDPRRQIHEYLYYFDNERVVGVRSPRWKLVSHGYYRRHLGAFEAFAQLPGFQAPYDLLFDMQGEGVESYSYADRYPAVVSRLKNALQVFRREVEPLQTRPPGPEFPARQDVQ